MGTIYNASSDYLENRIINWTLRNGDNPRASEWVVGRLYFSAHTADPTDASPVALSTELSGSGYSRAYSNWWADTIRTTGYDYLATEVDFPISTGSWGNITHFGMWTNLTAGSLVFHSSVVPSQGTFLYCPEGATLTMLAGADATRLSGSGIYNNIMLSHMYYHILNGNTLGKIGLTVYTRLMQTLPNAYGVGGVEVPYYTGGTGIPNGYTRVQVAGASNWTTPTTGSTSNTQTINIINPATADIGTITGMCLYGVINSAETLLYTLPFSTPIYVKTGDYVRFMPGTIKIGIE